MPPLHRLLAVPAATLAAGAVAVDTVVFATTGHRTVITDDAAGSPVVSKILGVSVGVTFALLCWSTWCERRRFAAANRAVRLARRPLTVGLGVLAVGIGLAHPLELLLGVGEDSIWSTVSSLVALAVLIVTQLSALVVGLASLRRNVLGVGGRILALVLPTMIITGLLAVFAPGFADPAYMSMVTILGVALIGVRARSARPASAPAPTVVGV